MARALVHFLVGASFVVLLATPLALRYETGRRHGLVLATAGGMWGMFPDLHHVAPVYGGPIRTFHQSVWADLGAFVLAGRYTRRDLRHSHGGTEGTGPRRGESLGHPTE